MTIRYLSSFRYAVPIALTCSLACSYEVYRNDTDGGSAGAAGETSTNGFGGSGGESSEGGSLGGTAGETSSNGTSSGTTSTGGTTGDPLAPLEGEWHDVTANLAGLETECGSVTRIFTKPDEDIVYTGIARRGLWASDNAGESWEPIGGSDDSDTIVNRPRMLVFDPEDRHTFWESGIYGGPGVFKTTDNGDTFIAQGDVEHVDGISIDWSDPDRQIMLAGGHEKYNMLFLSTNGGEEWTNIGDALPEGNCTMPVVISPEVFLVGCSVYGDGFRGVLKSVDGGDSWYEVSDRAGGLQEPLVLEDGTIYWFHHSGRGLERSTDDGETWEQINENEVRSQPVLLPNGRFAALGTDSIIASDDGEVWQAASPAFPEEWARVTGLAYSKHRKAYFIWRTNCVFDGAVVLEDSLRRFDIE